ncbi:: hypothetical protein [Arcticibacter svalbardensis MN12-7]|uniref:Deoxyuridine 5'-triphosphate nucleotidohydrolase n=1 Tax=Arcticibacter svalbardensis MN12-7 TaxID=1150600 RepID=R9H1C7_9SPHI|nr:DUF4292 domain-containing protein [Arcticibacter svalbardensis]EOR95029.1 : hypothetical protein [Arcticibacter svalbardensis MN12-7]
MKRNTQIKILVLLSVILSGFGCKTRKEVKPAVVPPVVKVTSNKSAVIAAINSSAFEFNTLSAKSKVGLMINTNSNDVSMNIRMQNKSIIWISVTAIAGIEVARVLITPDSIKVLNRIQGLYTAKPFSYIYQYANKQITFSTLQNLFLGNAIEGTVTESSVFSVHENQTQITSALSGMLYKLIMNANNKVVENTLQDPKGQRLIAKYADFQAVNGRKLPYSINLSSNATNRNIKIDLKYTSVSVNESLDFPFSVPKRFTVKD